MRKIPPSRKIRITNIKCGKFNKKSVAFADMFGRNPVFYFFILNLKKSLQKNLYCGILYIISYHICLKNKSEVKNMDASSCGRSADRAFLYGYAFDSVKMLAESVFSAF